MTSSIPFGWLFLGILGILFGIGLLIFRVVGSKERERHTHRDVEVETALAHQHINYTPPVFAPPIEIPSRRTAVRNDTKHNRRSVLQPKHEKKKRS